MEKLALTIEEVAQILSISKSLAYDAVRQGVIPSLRIGKRYVVSRKYIEKMVDETGRVQLQTK
jgi:excisionase family DNA binding protein